MKRILSIAAVILLVAGCRQAAYPTVEGRVVDATIHSVTVLTAAGDSVTVSTLGTDPMLVPGVLSNSDSPEYESFTDGLLEYPQYTRPEVWHDRTVPAILLSGDHAKVDKWRHEMSLERTKQRRPDLYERYISRK